MLPIPNFRIPPQQLRLLEAFSKPTDIPQLLRWWTSNIDNPSAVVEKWISDGILVTADAEAVLSKIFQIHQLKELLQNRNLPLSGNKPELIKRLLDNDKLGMEEILSDHKLFLRSPESQKIIDECKQQIKSAFEFAKQKCFELLKEGKAKDACKVFVAYQRYVNDPKYQISPDTVREIQCALESTPQILSNFSPEIAKMLQVMAGMKKLWGEHTSILNDWLPENLGSVVLTDDMQAAMNYIRVSADIKLKLDDYKEFAKQVKISFHPGDIESCNLCLALDGQIFNINEVPVLPMLGCKSKLGCQCNINIVYDGFDNDTDDDFEEGFGEDVDKDDVEVDDDNLAKEDPLNTLRILKQLLDENLITIDEYNQKKTEILSRL